jgi:hypothetical protein
MPACHFCNGKGRERGVLFRLCPECDGCGRRERKPVDPSNAKMADLVLQLGVREFTPNGPTVVQIEAGKPWTAHIEATKVLQTLSGDVRICDPYYGQGSLMRIAELTSATSVKLLTKTADSKERAYLPKAIQDFVREHTAVELREYSGNDIHDRYIVTNDDFVILGHGLKDIGNKESFVVRLPRKLVGDTIDTLRASFDQKWQTARRLP